MLTAHNPLPFEASSMVNIESGISCSFFVVHGVHNYNQALLVRFVVVVVVRLRIESGITCPFFVVVV